MIRNLQPIEIKAMWCHLAAVEKNQPEGPTS